MEELLSLRNYTNLLDPNEIDNANLLHRKDGVKMQATKTEGDYAASVEHDLKIHHCSLKLGSSREIKEYKCDCAAFKGGKTPDEPCVHLISLVIAINNGDMPTEGKPAAKSLTKKAATSKKATKPVKVVEKKLPKDPALRMLHQLSASEIFAYLEKALKDNKEINNNFLIHFSSKTEISKESIIKIVNDARKAVMGRRGQMNVPEANKVGKMIKPLFDQAVEAEASGSFLYSFGIVSEFIIQLREMFGYLNSENNQIVTLAEKSHALIAQIASNKSAPNEVIERVYDFALAQAFSVRPYENYFHARWLATTETCAERLDKVAKHAKELEIRIEKYSGLVGGGKYTDDHAMLQYFTVYFVGYVEKHNLYSLKQLEAFVKTYMRLPSMYSKLIHISLAKGDNAAAKDHADGMQKLFKNNYYVNRSHLERELAAVKFNLIYAENNNKELLTFLAELIYDDAHNAKSILAMYEAKLNDKASYLTALREISKILSGKKYSNFYANLRFLDSVKLYPELTERLLELKNPIVVSEFASELAKWDEQRFMDLINNNLEKWLVKYVGSNYFEENAMQSLYRVIQKCKGGKELIDELYVARNGKPFRPRK